MLQQEVLNSLVAENDKTISDNLYLHLKNMDWKKLVARWSFTKMSKNLLSKIQIKKTVWKTSSNMLKRKTMMMIQGFCWLLWEGIDRVKTKLKKVRNSFKDIGAPNTYLVIIQNCSRNSLKKELYDSLYKHILHTLINLTLTNETN